MKIRPFAVVFIAHLMAITGSLGEDLPCAQRVTEYGTVCVCNASYCDTVTRPDPLPKGQFYQYVTSQDSPGFTKSWGAFHKIPGVGDDVNETIILTIDSSIVYQEIVGIGASFTDSAGIAVSSLPEGAQTSFIESYFGKNGIEHSMARVPIGCSDFSTHLYTYDDEEDDDDLSNFSLVQEDFSFKIPLIQKALNVSSRGIKLVGCTFTAPKWMKLNDAYSSGLIKDSSKSAWAKYHIKFLDAYAENGITFWSLSGGNEVLESYFISEAFLLGTLALSVNQREWLKTYLGPQLKASNHSQVKFTVMDDMRSFGKYYMSRFARDPEVFEYVNGVGLHWYYDWVYPASMLDDIHQAYPDKMILYTESSPNVILFGGSYIELGSWQRGALYMYNIIENINHWTNGYLDWNMALNVHGGPYLQLPVDAAVIVNATAGEFYKNPIFYGVGHFSKFMPPGSRRISVQSNLNQTNVTVNVPSLNPELAKLLLRQNMAPNVFGQSDTSSSTPQTVLPTFPDIPIATVPCTVSCLATVNPDNSTTVVVFNSMDYPIKVTIVDKLVGSFTKTLATQSINTFLYWPNNTDTNHRSP